MSVMPSSFFPPGEFRRSAVLFIVLFFAIAAFFRTEARAKSLSDVFDRVNGSVVVIHASEHTVSFDKPGLQVMTRSMGSGVVISEDGLILTAAHISQVADSLSVEFLEGPMETAKVVSSSALADVALIKLDHKPDNLVVANLGDSDRVRVGDEVFVVGAPYGVNHTLTVGHVSGRRKPKIFTDQITPVEFLQTDAAINRGNSGGPMFNMNGEVIGIVSRIMSQSGGDEGLGFAASINIAKELLLNRKAFWFGVEFFPLTGALAKALNLPQKAGLLIQRVADRSPGDYLGLRSGGIPVQIGEKQLILGGDILLAIQDIPVSSDPDSLDAIRETMSGLDRESRVDVKILRDGAVKYLFMDNSGGSVEE